MCITKLDVMDGIEEIKICTGYEFEGKTIDILPFGADAVAKCKPIYETLPGWKESTFGVKEYDALPENAKRYLKRIEEVCGAPVAIISTGPDRDENHPAATSVCLNGLNAKRPSESPASAFQTASFCF